MPKQVFWSGLKGGLFDEKHRVAMGQAFWLYGWFATRQTGLNDAGEGLVLYGNPLTRKSMSADTGYSVRNIKLWMDRLRQAGYIRTVSDGHRGTRIFLINATAKSKNPKPRTQYFPIQCQPNENQGGASLARYGAGPTSHLDLGQKSDRQGSVTGHPDVHAWPINCPGKARNSKQNQPLAVATNTFILTLPNYNSTPLAESARSHLSSLSVRKQLPTAKTEVDPDERRKLLQKQKEEVLARYSRPESTT